MIKMKLAQATGFLHIYPLPQTNPEDVTEVKGRAMQLLN
jgi:hypothetical protein